MGKPAAWMINELIGPEEVKPANAREVPKFWSNGAFGTLKVWPPGNRTLIPIGGQKLPRSNPNDVMPPGRLTVIPEPGHPHGT
jgi:hypothetical protein